jgi:hypothetical protein
MFPHQPWFWDCRIFRQPLDSKAEISSLNKLNTNILRKIRQLSSMGVPKVVNLALGGSDRQASF